jgi:hypothetical protein
MKNKIRKLSPLQLIMADLSNAEDRNILIFDLIGNGQEDIDWYVKKLMIENAEAVRMAQDRLRKFVGYYSR